MIERWAKSEMELALTDTPVVLVHGPRQAGKSTLVQELSGSRTFVTLDDPEPHRLAKMHPAEFLHAFPPPVTIDEIQRAPELFLPMKAWIDRQRRPGSFLLTGSANVLLLPKMADSLAGRMEIVDLPPLSQAEIEGAKDNFVDWVFGDPTCETAFANSPPPSIGDLARRVTTGGYPEPVLRSPKRRSPWFNDYLRTILDRDVRDIANIEGLTQVPRILRLLAARAGEPLNASSLSRDTGIPHSTMTRYLSLLQTIFLVQSVPAWSSDTGIRLARSPKAYLSDTGLLCHLLQIDEADFERSPLMGALLQNFAAVELSKLCLRSELKPALGHLRTVKLKQVDFVLDAAMKGVVGIEIRPSFTIAPSDTEGLRYLKELAGDRFRLGVVLYLGERVQPLGKDLWALPFNSLWGGAPTG